MTVRALWLFLRVPLVDLQYVIVVFTEDTDLFFLWSKFHSLRDTTISQPISLPSWQLCMFLSSFYTLVDKLKRYHNNSYIEAQVIYQVLYSCQDKMNLQIKNYIFSLTIILDPSINTMDHQKCEINNFKTKIILFVIHFR